MLTTSSPYKFQAPWHAFEFAYHVIAIEANIVILSMAWLTREEPRQFSRMPQEPDMDTLTYWVTRLEPVIRADGEEIIFVFCNRTGIEGDAVYAGTSAVVGIKDGEVHVYGLLGRGDKELLIVDTDKPPFAKLVYRPEGEETTAEKGESEFSYSGVQSVASSIRSATSGRKPASKSSSTVLPERKSPVQQSKSGPAQARTTTSKRQVPKIEIPKKATRANDGESANTVPTPTGPSPTPVTLRPNVMFPAVSHPAKSSSTNLTPHHNKSRPGFATMFDAADGLDVGVEADVDSPDPQIDDDMDASPNSMCYYWIPSDNLLKSSAEKLAAAKKGWVPAVPDSPTYTKRSSFYSNDSGSLVNSNVGGSTTKKNPAKSSTPFQGDGALRKKPGTPAATATHVKDETAAGRLPERPSSPKSRNASRTRMLDGSDFAASQHEALNAISQRLEARSLSRSGSAAPQNQEPPSVSDATSQPYDSSVSQTDASSEIGRIFSPSSIYIGATTSLLERETIRPSPAFQRPESRMEQNGINSPFRTSSRSDEHFRKASISGQPIARPPSSNSFRKETPLHSSATRTVSRGREPESSVEDIMRPSGSGFPMRAASGPLIEFDRSILVAHGLDEEFARIEGFVSPDCPVHGAHPTPSLSRPSPPTNTPAVREDLAAAAASIAASAAMRSPMAAMSPPPLSQPPRPHTVGLRAESAAAGVGYRGTANVNLFNGGLDPSPTSVETTATSGRSPATPLHEPSTPKAMTLVRDEDDLLSTVSSDSSMADPTGSLNLLKADAPGMGQFIERPRSAVW